MTKLTVAAGVACALFAGSALAADLPSRKAPPVYVPPPPVFSWTGLYGGINIGYGFGNGDRDVGGLGYLASPTGVLPSGAAWSLNNNLQGVVGGGQVGYNFQFKAAARSAITSSSIPGWS
jgi:outer membrane immunogenic protein